MSVATSAGARVDLIDRSFGLRALYEEAIEAAQTRGPRVTIADTELPVVPLPFLVAMKMAADRPQDEADLDRLIRRPDLAYAATRALVERHLGYFAAQPLASPAGWVHEQATAGLLARRETAPPRGPAASGASGTLLEGSRDGFSDGAAPARR